ncbi:MAG: hemolysin family protein [Tissierellia bacterium]|nr:hemolysin family protein [Tissierellia bacterium]
MEDAGPMALIFKIFVVLILISINALFSAIEMSVISLDAKRLERYVNNGDMKAKSLLEIIKKQQDFIATIQFSKTLIAFSTIIYIFHDFEKFYDYEKFILPLWLYAIIIMVIIALVNVIIADLIPRRLSVLKPYALSFKMVGLVKLLIVLTKPFIIISTKIADIFIKLMGKESGNIEKQVTVEEIRSIVQKGENQGIIKPMESQMINSVIGFEQTLAEEIMTARPEVFMIDINDVKKSYLDKLLEMKYSRIPVYDGDIDKILGILYIKDYLIEAHDKGFDNIKLKDLIKPGYFVPERIEINKLFMEMKKNNTHIALLIDEYGGFSGIVTMEDLLEEIVGDIDDEYDDDVFMKKTKKGEYIVRGSVPVRDLNNWINTDIDEESEDFDTLGGFIIDKLGFVPEKVAEAKKIIQSGFSFEVMSIKDNRIVRVRISKIDEKK